MTEDANQTRLENFALWFVPSYLAGIAFLAYFGHFLFIPLGLICMPIFFGIGLDFTTIKHGGGDS